MLKTTNALAMLAILPAALAVPAGAASTVPDARFHPAPGLYKLETLSDATAHQPAGRVQSRTAVDAATGAASTQFRRLDGSTGGHALPGDGPQQVCIRPLKAASLPQGMQVDGCRATPGRVVGDSMVATNTCPWGKVETRIRQVDARTWETTAHTVITGAPSAAATGAGLMAMRSMAEKMAKEGTPEQRAEAREFLANSQGLEAELAKHGQAPLPPAAAPVQETRTVQRMVRIGDCK